jgi:hypothetical protein
MQILISENIEEVYDIRQIHPDGCFFRSRRYQRYRADSGGEI